MGGREREEERKREKESGRERRREEGRVDGQAIEKES